MVLIAGVDSSTQSTKVELRDVDSGRVVGRGRASHPVVTPPRSEQDPAAWWAAFDAAWSEACDAAGSTDVAAISVAGQQHGMVALDEHDQPIHPAKLWNDTESSPDAAWLIDQLGSPEAWAERMGSVPVAAFTITKLSWLHRTSPAAWQRVRRVMLPHDYLTFRLTGRYTTDRGDASGTGYWSPAEGSYRWDLLDLVDGALEWADMVPEVLGPLDTAGHWRGALVAPGTGDNMAAALGIGLGVGDAMMSVGTSGTVCAVSEVPTSDPSGAVAGFADATGRFLPLVCTSNAVKVTDTIRRLLGVDHTEFDQLALDAQPGGPVLLPYFDGERTPYRPDALGAIGQIRSDVTREQFARSAVDGVACGLLDALDALRSVATVNGRLVLVGGGARSLALRSVIAGLCDLPVVLGDADEAVAAGAAVQAASVLEQLPSSAIIERWGLGASSVTVEGVDGAGARDRYAMLRDQ